MSLLVHYTLKDKDDHDNQATAMRALVAGLKSEGIADLNYSCFSTPDRVKFVGLLEFPDDATKQGFLNSAAFSVNRETVGPTFTNAPQTTEIGAIASTRN